MILKYLEFLVVKRLEQVLWDELVEALLQSEELGLDASHEPPVHVEPVQTNKQKYQQLESPCLRAGKQKRKINNK